MVRTLSRAAMPAEGPGEFLHGVLPGNKSENAVSMICTCACYRLSDTANAHPAAKRSSSAWPESWGNPKPFCVNSMKVRSASSLVIGEWGVKRDIESPEAAPCSSLLGRHSPRKPGIWLQKCCSFRYHTAHNGPAISD